MVFTESKLFIIKDVFGNQITIYSSVYDFFIEVTKYGKCRNRPIIYLFTPLKNAFVLH